MQLPGVFFLFLLFMTPGCKGSLYSLVDRFPDATTRFDHGHYPSFVQPTGPRGDVDIAGDIRPALTPPFPARIRYELEVPRAAFFTFSPALVLEQGERRARVEFIVALELDGQPTSVYQELFRFNRANEWHAREIDLTAWSGKRVALILETRTPRERANVPWADRIQTAWGEPVIVSNQVRHTVATAGRIADSVIGPEEIEVTLRLAINMLLGGLLAIFIRELYKRYGTASNREEFAGMFPLFTLTTIVVITVVQVSLALSLGLIGALSIVRFRAAIKSPEEIVYLLFCVAVGLGLGADHRLLTVVTVAVITLFVVSRSMVRRPPYERTLLLTLSGDAKSFFSAGGSVLDRVQEVAQRISFRRLDHEDDRVSLRAVIAVDETAGPTRVVEALKERLPSLQISYVDTEEIL
jgi:hypothetical protein